MNNYSEKKSRDLIDLVYEGKTVQEGNPYLAELTREIIRNKHLEKENLVSHLTEIRHDFVERYAFAVPTNSLLKTIAGYSPLIEIGAGSGYWAMCLAEAGADVIAFDIRPPGENSPWDWQSANQWFDDTWYTVMDAGEEIVQGYPERALFLCWPPVHSPMAFNALSHYRSAGGHTVIYIGDPGSSADSAFHQELQTHRILHRERTVTWPGIDEELIIISLSDSAE